LVREVRRRVAPIFDDLLEKPDREPLEFRPRLRRETGKLVAQNPEELLEGLRPVPV